MSKLDLGDGIAEWTAESGQTIDMRYMWSSHVDFAFFECYSPARLTHVTGFDVGTPLSEGMRPSLISCHCLLTENLRRLYCLRTLTIMRKEKCLEMSIGHCSVQESSTRMVRFKTPPNRLTPDDFLRRNVEVCLWSWSWPRCMTLLIDLALGSTGP